MVLKLIPEVRKRLKNPAPIIRSVAQLLLKECFANDVGVEERFLIYYLYMVTLKAKSSDEEREALELLNEFVSETTKVLAMVKMPSINTLKMQFLFLDNCRDLQLVKLKHFNFLQRKTKRLVKEIVSVSNQLTKDEKSDLIRKIAVDIVIQNGLGSPKNSKTLLETEIAVQSVMCSSELAAFVKLRKSDKVRTLEDLRKVVCGIRLFNKDAGHGGEGILDLPTIVAKSFESTQLLLEFETDKMAKTVQNVNDILFSILQFDGDNLIPRSCCENAADIVPFLKDLSVLVHQKNLFLSHLLGILNGSKERIFDTVNKFKDGLRLIHEKVQFRTAIPTEEIYPRFRRIGSWWKDLQSYVFFLTDVNVLNEKLQKFDQILDSVKDLLAIYVPTPPDNPLNQTLEISISNPNVELLKYEKIIKLTDLKFAFKGFCPWALSEGFLILGNSELGSIKYKTQFFIFSCPNAISNFANQPDSFLISIDNWILDKPELIVTLDLVEVFKGFSFEQEETFSRNFISTTDQAVQTDKEVNLVNDDYNIEELRKRAQHLANLANYRNHATQTSMTGSNKEAETQTLNLKHKSIQTPVDKGV